LSGDKVPSSTDAPSRTLAHACSMALRFVCLLALFVVVCPTSAAASSPVAGGVYEGDGLRFMVTDNQRGVYRPARADPLTADPVLSWKASRCTPSSGTWPLALEFDKRGRFDFADRMRVPNGVESLDLRGHFGPAGRRLLGAYRVRIRYAAPVQRSSCDTGWRQLKGVRFTGYAQTIRGTCNVAGSTTLFSNPAGRVFSRTYHSQYLRDDVTFYYGCARAEHKRFLLSSEFSLTHAKPSLVAMEGRFVAYRAVRDDGASGAAWVEVTNLSTGKIVRSWEELPKRPNASGEARQIVVTPTGAIAWTAAVRPSPTAAPTEFDLYKSDSTGLARLDSGADLDPLSLMLDRRTLSWHKGTNVVSTVLAD
jgi:hypothetical protein